MKDSVFIKVKASKELPKEEGLYFVSQDEKYDRPKDVFSWINYDGYKEEWLKYVVYWLKELPREEYEREVLNIPSNELIQREAEKQGKTLIKGPRPFRATEHEIFAIWISACQWFKNYKR